MFKTLRPLETCVWCGASGGANGVDVYVLPEGRKARCKKCKPSGDACRLCGFHAGMTYPLSRTSPVRVERCEHGLLCDTCAGPNHFGKKCDSETCTSLFEKTCLECDDCRSVVCGCALVRTAAGRVCRGCDEAYTAKMCEGACGRACRDREGEYAPCAECGRQACRSCAREAACPPHLKKCTRLVFCGDACAGTHTAREHGEINAVGVKRCRNCRRWHSSVRKRRLELTCAAKEKCVRRPPTVVWCDGCASSVETPGQPESRVPESCPKFRFSLENPKTTRESDGATEDREWICTCHRHFRERSTDRPVPPRIVSPQDVFIYGMKNVL